MPDTHRLRGYRIDDPALPAAYRQYPVGVSEDENDEDLHVGVFDTSAGRLVFVIDLGDIETAEWHLHLFLVGMVLFAEPATAGRIISLALIVAGIVGLKLATA